MKKYKFNNPTLEQEFQRLANDPDRLCLNEELAITRMSLKSMVERIGKDKGLTDLSVESLTAFNALSSQVADVCESISRIERGMMLTLNVEQLTIATQKIAQVAAKYIDPAQINAFFEELKTIKRSE